MKVFYLKLLFGLTILCNSYNGITQPSIWYFGAEAGVKFKGSSVDKLCNSKLSANEGTAVATDVAGNLLFYTDGVHLYDASNKQVIHNGKYDFLGGSLSSTHSVLIVPVPGAGCHSFFIFTTDASENLDKPNYRGFECTLVKLDNNGLHVKEGPVPIYAFNYGNQKIRRGTEKIAATSDGNGGFWVLHHTTGNNNSDKTGFVSLHIQPNTKTVGQLFKTIKFTSMGSNHEGYTTGNYNVQGQMKFSPDGRTLALVVPDQNSNHLVIDNFMEVFSFNPQTGHLLNVISTIEREQIVGQLKLSSVIKNLYGVEFSPDSKLLYISEGYSPTSQTINSLKSHYGNVYQFNLKATNILASVEIVATMNTYNPSNPINNFYPIGALQLGPDKKIYVARPKREFISCITNPNQIGGNSGFVDHAIPISDPTDPFCKLKESNLGLPTMVIGSECNNETQNSCECFLIHNTNLRSSIETSFLDLQLSTNEACIKSVKVSVLSVNTQNPECIYDPNSMDNTKIVRFISPEENNFNQINKYYSFGSQVSEWTKIPNIGRLDHTMFVAQMYLPKLDKMCGEREVCFKVELTNCSCGICEEIICRKYGEPLSNLSNLNYQESIKSPENTSQINYIKNLQTEILIQPNTVSDNFELIHNLNGTDFQLQIFNSLGIIVFNGSYKSKKIHIYKPLPPGLYDLSIQNEKGQMAKAKFIK